MRANLAELFKPANRSKCMNPPIGPNDHWRGRAVAELGGYPWTAFQQDLEAGRIVMKHRRVGDRRILEVNALDACAWLASQGVQFPASQPVASRHASITLACSLRGASPAATASLIASSCTLDEVRAILALAVPHGHPITDVGIDRLLGLHYLAKGEIENISGVAA